MSGERSSSREQQPGDAPARLSVGNVLKAERERRNFSIDDIAANLRIRRASLDAIENGRFKELPGAPYAVGFVKAYAEFLDLDREEIIRRFKEEAAGLDSHKELNFPRPLSESRLPGGVLLLLSGVIAASAYGIWYFQSSGERASLPRVAAVPERLAPLADPVATRPPEARAAENTQPAPVVAQPEPTTVAAPTATEATPVQSAAAVNAPATSAAPATATPAAPAPVSVASAPAAAPVDPAVIPAAPTDSPAQPRIYGEGAARIVIRATADSWIQVRDTSGAVVFTRVMRAGDSYNVPNRPGLSLYTGSAGALEISVDGKVVPSVGQFGAVRRDVMLDADRLAAGTAVLDGKRPTASDSSRPSQSSAGSDVSRP